MSDTQNGVTQNASKQWCTTDVYGGQTPHPNKEAAERVASSDERS